LVLTRHNVAHNFGHYDDKLRNRVEKYIEKLKTEIPQGDLYLSLLSLQASSICARLLAKFLFLDVFSKN